jgi:malate dehydrogenase (quinone)
MDNSHQIPQTDVVLIMQEVEYHFGYNYKTTTTQYQYWNFERLDVAAAESSDAWNNAGTGHSAFVN